MQDDTVCDSNTGETEACLIGTVRGHGAEAVRELGKAVGMGGRTGREARDSCSEVCWREGLCLALSADVLCNILFCCVQWELMWVQYVISAYLCLQIHLWDSLDEKRMLFDFATTCCCLALAYLNHANEKVLSFSHISLCSSLQVPLSSMVRRCPDFGWD